MTHKASSRGGSGGKIHTLELTAPRPIASGAEYFLTSEGSLVTQQEITPFVATPLAGTSLANYNFNYCYQGTSDPFFSTMDPYIEGINNQTVVRVPLVAPFEMYLTKPEGSTTSNLVSCLVYNTDTGERVAEHLFNLGAGNGTSIARNAHYAIVPAGTNKWCVLYDYSTNSGSTWQNRVGEYTFNGTDTVTFAWKTALGPVNASNTIFCGQGRGVSEGKVAISRAGVFSIINLIANTINSAAGFAGIHHVEGQYGLSFNASNSISVTNYETNGSSSFTATGATLLSDDHGIKLTPTVYLQGLLTAPSVPNRLRLIVFNSTYTAAVVTLVPCPILSEMAKPAVFQPRSGVLSFIIADSFRNVNAQYNESSGAVTFSINSDGVLTKPVRSAILDSGTARFMRTVVIPGTISDPIKLDQPVWSVNHRSTASSVGSQDGAALLLVKFRPDFYIGQFKPKYLGRALATVIQGAVASFAASPEMLAVDPVQTAFQRVGRVIKVNDLQGFFYDYQASSFGLEEGYAGAASLPGNIGIDAAGFNYPWVVGVQSPVTNGRMTFTGWNTTTSSIQAQVLLITPTCVSVSQLVGTATQAPRIEAAFSGFLVAAIRLDDLTTNIQFAGAISIQAEEADYV